MDIDDNDDDNHGYGGNKFLMILTIAILSHAKITGICKEAYAMYL